MEQAFEALSKLRWLALVTRIALSKTASVRNLPNLHFTNLTLNQPADFCQHYFYSEARKCDA